MQISIDFCIILELMGAIQSLKKITLERKNSTEQWWLKK